MEAIKQTALEEYKKVLAVLNSRCETDEEAKEYGWAKVKLQPVFTSVPANAKEAAKAEALIAEMDGRRKKHGAAVKAAFKRIQELTFPAAVEECRKYLGLALELADCKKKDIPDPVVKFDFFKAEKVGSSDWQELQSIGEKLAKLLDVMCQRIATNEERIEAARQRTEADPVLVDKIAALEEKRGRALLNGDDLTDLNNELFSLKEAAEASKMASRLAAKDVEKLKENGALLTAQKEKIREVAAHVEVKTAALKLYGMVSEYNDMSEKLLSKFSEMKALQRKGCNSNLYINESLITMPICGDVKKLVLPLWHGFTWLPDEEGNFRPDEAVKEILWGEE